MRRHYGRSEVGERDVSEFAITYVMATSHFMPICLVCSANITKIPLPTPYRIPRYHREALKARKAKQAEESCIRDGGVRAKPAVYG